MLLSTDKCLQAALSQVGLPEYNVMAIIADRLDKTPEQAVNKVNWPGQKVFRSQITNLGSQGTAKMIKPSFYI